MIIKGGAARYKDGDVFKDISVDELNFEKGKRNGEVVDAQGGKITMTTLAGSGGARGQDFKKGDKFTYLKEGLQPMFFTVESEIGPTKYRVSLDQ